MDSTCRETLVNTSINISIGLLYTILYTNSEFTWCSSKRSAVIRASDDFWPRDPASHTIHIASVAYNSIFLGEFMQPDWDMFQVSAQILR